LPRPKGLPKTGGRQRGTPNKTPAFRAVVLEVFDQLGGATWLKAFAQTNPVEFARVLARLMPLEHEHSGPDGGPIQVNDHFHSAAEPR
jgi:hypothetical protein